MADSTLEPLQRAVAARRLGKIPSDSDLEVCRKYRWLVNKEPSLDLTCWNGNVYTSTCGHYGSLNWPVLAEAGLANWDWVVELCTLEQREGDFGVEHGSTSHFYYGAVFGAKVTTYHALRELGRDNDAEVVHTSILSHLAWDALAAIPVPRMRDTVYLPDRKIETITKRKDTWLTVAVSGMRNTPIARGQFSSQNSHSLVLANAIDDPASIGLSNEEQALLRLTVFGDISAAREVSEWMIGVIDSPNRVWQWHLTRTTLGVQSHMAGLSAPNPMKPCIAGTIVTANGEWLAIQTSHKVSGWALGHRVWVEKGEIHAESRIQAGKRDLVGRMVHTSMPTLESMGGKVLWAVDIIGKQVTFREG